MSQLFYSCRHIDILLPSQRVLTSSGIQTDPVHDESAFDWDLSDRTDTETQTLPPTRAGSTSFSVGGGGGGGGGRGAGGVGYSDHFLQDAIVQTDQRLVFLIKRAGGGERAHGSD